jgi:hypothetical protein
MNYYSRMIVSMLPTSFCRIRDSLSCHIRSIKSVISALRLWRGVENQSTPHLTNKGFLLQISSVLNVKIPKVEWYMCRTATLNAERFGKQSEESIGPKVDHDAFHGNAYSSRNQRVQKKDAMCRFNCTIRLFSPPRYSQ